MKLRIVLPTALTLILATACGDGTGTVYTLESGTYHLSNVSATAPDNCNLGTTFPDGSEFVLTVTSTSVTVALGSSDPSRNPISAINGNTLETSPAKTYEVVDDSTCTEVLTVTHEGEITAKNTYDGIVTLQAAAKTGSTGCTPTLTGYKTVPCSSSMSFTGTKM